MAVSLTLRIKIILQLKEMAHFLSHMDIPDEVSIQVTQDLSPHGHFEGMAEKDNKGMNQPDHEVKSAMQRLNMRNVYTGPQCHIEFQQSGERAVKLLREAAFGELATPQGNKSDPLSGLPMDQMDRLALFHQGCLSLLCSLVHQRTAMNYVIKLLKLGKALSLPEIEEESLMYVLANLSSVVENSAEDWRQMSEREVLSILSSKHVISDQGEMGIWRALRVWIDQSEDRIQLLPKAIATCIRLKSLTATELVQLRSEDMIKGSHQSSSMLEEIISSEKLTG